MFASHQIGLARHNGLTSEWSANLTLPELRKGCPSLGNNRQGMATSPLCRLLVQVTADLREEQLEFGIGSEAATIHPLDENPAIMATAWKRGQYVQCRAYSFSEAVARRPKLSEKVVLAAQIVPQGRRSCDRRRRGRWRLARLRPRCLQRRRRTGLCAVERLAQHCKRWSARAGE